MKVGTDPEYFLWSTAENRPVPAHRVFPDKHEPIDLGFGMRAFRDGFAVELNVPAQEDPKVLMESVQEALYGLRQMLRGSGYQLRTAPTVPISIKDDLADAPEDVLHFGCEPSYCAYDGRSKSPQINAWEHPWRYAGAHMHFSASPEELEGWASWLKDKPKALGFIRLMDIHVGLPLTRKDPSEAQFMRRQYYGQAGEFRPQHYPDGSIGLEYRTPASGQLEADMFYRGMYLFRSMSVKPLMTNQLVRKAINTGVGLHGVTLAPEKESTLV